MVQNNGNPLTAPVEKGIQSLKGTVDVQVLGSGSLGKLEGKDGKQIAGEIKNSLSFSKNDITSTNITLISCKSGVCDENNNSLVDDVQNALGPRTRVKGFYGNVGVSDSGKIIKNNT